MLRLIAAGLMAVAIWQLSGAALIHAKAWLAPILIERAWEKSLDTRKQVKPWPWADTWPVAKLEVPSLGIVQYVLAGANGASLPFGPGHMEGTALPGDPGTIVFAAHRDTHFSFLEDVQLGATVRVSALNKAVRTFRITNQEIVDARKHGILPMHTGSELVLVTCEPTSEFSYQGPFRLVVTAKPLMQEGPVNKRNELFKPRAVHGSPIRLADGEIG